MNEHLLLAIDGETAAGKGTLAKRIAKQNELYYLGTGQLFRAFGFLVLNKLAHNAVDGAEYFSRGEASYEWDGQDSKLCISGEDVTAQLDADFVAVQTSYLAKDPDQQSIINGVIRQFSVGILKNEGMVSEGRNTATALFPEHDLAFYITADIAVRAQRRHNDHQRDGRDISYTQLFNDLVARDERDKKRTSNPLGPTPDAIIIDTSAVTIDDAQDQIQHHINTLGA